MIYENQGPPGSTSLLCVCIPTTLGGGGRLFWQNVVNPYCLFHVCSHLRRSATLTWLTTWQTGREDTLTSILASSLQKHQWVDTSKKIVVVFVELGGYLDLDTGVFTAETPVSCVVFVVVVVVVVVVVDSILQGTYSISWSYQGPPGCVWLYRGGERVSEALVANMMVGHAFNLVFWCLKICIFFLLLLPAKVHVADILL